MKQPTNHREQNSRLDKVSTNIAATILKWQLLYTKNLEDHTKHWQQKHQWIFLCLICLGFGGLSILFVVNPFLNKPSPNFIITKSISLPKHIYTINKPFQITDKEFEEAQEYKKQHKDLLKERPGLYDSLEQIEEMYYSQKK